ncbi:MAG: DUF4249 domain-containing protein [Dysgonamonadaceae bacterium]|jgi:hypothetical protein|nr:DUF4249 domain-containing protein [Dysgonamonadaceae bacterium]
MKRYFYILGITLLLVSCAEENAVQFIEYTPKVAVEGWIENGFPAVVLLSRTAPFDHPLDTTALMKQIITSAKVSVSDGEQTEILTLGVNYDYMPPYIYYGQTLRGETGKTYTLKIEYNNQVISAETYIPEPVPLDSCWFVKTSPSDTTGYIHVRWKNTSDAYYQIATKVAQKETVYTPCLYGNFSAAQLTVDAIVEIQINKGPMLFPKIQFNTYFSAGETVYLKFRTQPKAGYDFWTSWQNEILNAQNPIFPAHTNLISNIQGGTGLWCGYGTYTYQIETQ